MRQNVCMLWFVVRLSGTLPEYPNMNALKPALVMTLGMFAAQVQTTQDDAPKSSAEQRLAFAGQSAGAYRFRIKGQDKLEIKLHPEPLLRWNNKVIREDDGLLFIWTEGDKGRPLATAQFFVVETNWHHEFQSLSVNGFDAQFEG